MKVERDRAELSTSLRAQFFAHLIINLILVTIIFTPMNENSFRYLTKISLALGVF